MFLKGADHLTVTWKVDEGVYQHVDVREEGKENAFSLGRSLWIDSEVRNETQSASKGLKDTNKAPLVMYSKQKKPNSSTATNFTVMNIYSYLKMFHHIEKY